MTVRDMLTALQALPRDAELLAFEAGCETTANARSMIISGRYLSHRTVGYHLHRIYPKLGISSRRQLHAAMLG